jgi:hypothetical protein
MLHRYIAFDKHPRARTSPVGRIDPRHVARARPLVLDPAGTTLKAGEGEDENRPDARQQRQQPRSKSLM